jgi:CHAD domain-containing protein
MLGPLRDIHIELERARNLKDGPRLAEFRTHLGRRKRALEKEVSRRARDVKAGRLGKSIRKIERRLGHIIVSSRTKPRSAVRLLEAIDDDFEGVLERRRTLDPTQADTLHRLRIAVKEFRYGVEALAPLLRGFPRRRLEELRGLQVRLGDLHDLEMMSGSLKDFIRKHRRNGILRRSPLEKQLLRRHDRETQAAVRTTDRILEFWRHWRSRGTARLRGLGSSRARPVGPTSQR